MYINKWMHARFMYMLSMPQIYPCAHKTTLVIRFLPGLCKETVLPSFHPYPKHKWPNHHAFICGRWPDVQGLLIV